MNTGNQNDIQKKFINIDCFHYCTYSAQADTATIYPFNFVPDIKPKKHNNCNLSPLQLKGSLCFNNVKNQSDTEEQVRRFNTKRKTSKIISLSNASTSTDLPIIDLKDLISTHSRRFSIGNPTTQKISLKRITLKKKRLTILGGLIKSRLIGKVNL